jgi:hypothetical protein
LCSLRPTYMGQTDPPLAWLPRPVEAYSRTVQRCLRPWLPMRSSAPALGAAGGGAAAGAAAAAAVMSSSARRSGDAEEVTAPRPWEFFQREALQRLFDALDEEGDAALDRVGLGLLHSLVGLATTTASWMHQGDGPGDDHPHLVQQPTITDQTFLELSTFSSAPHQRGSPRRLHHRVDFERWYTWFDEVGVTELQQNHAWFRGLAQQMANEQRQAAAQVQLHSKTQPKEKKKKATTTTWSTRVKVGARHGAEGAYGARMMPDSGVPEASLHEWAEGPDGGGTAPGTAPGTRRLRWASATTVGIFELHLALEAAEEARAARQAQTGVWSVLHEAPTSIQAAAPLKWARSPTGLQRGSGGGGSYRGFHRQRRSPSHPGSPGGGGGGGRWSPSAPRNPTLSVGSLARLLQRAGVRGPPPTPSTAVAAAAAAGQERKEEEWLPAVVQAMQAVQRELDSRDHPAGSAADPRAPFTTEPAHTQRSQPAQQLEDQVVVTAAGFQGWWEDTLAAAAAAERGRGGGSARRSLGRGGGAAPAQGRGRSALQHGLALAVLLPGAGGGGGGSGSLGAVRSQLLRAHEQRRVHSVEEAAATVLQVRCAAEIPPCLPPAPLPHVQTPFSSSSSSSSSSSRCVRCARSDDDRLCLPGIACVPASANVGRCVWQTVARCALDTADRRTALGQELARLRARWGAARRRGAAATTIQRRQRARTARRWHELRAVAAATIQHYARCKLRKRRQARRLRRQERRRARRLRQMAEARERLLGGGGGGGSYGGGGDGGGDDGARGALPAGALSEWGGGWLLCTTPAPPPPAESEPVAAAVQPPQPPQRQYWFNQRTQETRWDAPPELGAVRAPVRVRPGLGKKSGPGQVTPGSAERMMGTTARLSAAVTEYTHVDVRSTSAGSGVPAGGEGGGVRGTEAAQQRGGGAVGSSPSRSSSPARWRMQRRLKAAHAQGAEWPTTRTALVKRGGVWIAVDAPLPRGGSGGEGRHGQAAAAAAAAAAGPAPHSRASSLLSPRLARLAQPRTQEAMDRLVQRKPSVAVSAPPQPPGARRLTSTTASGPGSSHSGSGGSGAATHRPASGGGGGADGKIQARLERPPSAPVSRPSSAQQLNPVEAAEAAAAAAALDPKPPPPRHSSTLVAHAGMQNPFTPQRSGRRAATVATARPPPRPPATATGGGGGGAPGGGGWRAAIAQLEQRRELRLARGEFEAAAALDRRAAALVEARRSAWRCGGRCVRLCGRVDWDLPG